MTLTASVFQQILSSLKSDTGRRFNEQRNSPRVGVRGKISILPLTVSREPVEVWVRDVSVTGIGLLCPQAFPAGTRLLARFPKVDDEPLSLAYIVAHCKSVSRGLYVIGARVAEMPQKRKTPLSANKPGPAKAPPLPAQASAAKAVETKGSSAPIKSQAKTASSAVSEAPPPPSRGPKAA